MPPTSPLDSRLFIVPPQPCLNYVRRPNIERWIHSHYVLPGMRRMVLYGSPGVGKTQLALEFARRVLMHHPATDVFWVHAGTRQALANSYWFIADALKLPSRHNPQTNFLELVRDHLQRDDVSPWFMIFDGVEDTRIFSTTSFTSSTTDIPDAALAPTAALSSFLPVSDKGKILATICSSELPEELGSEGFDGAPVSDMDEAQALELVRRTSQDLCDADAAASLIRTVGHLPLALNQAVAYITARQITVSSYILEPSLNYFLDSFSKTWIVTFEHIRQVRPSAAKLLLLISQFHGCNIPSDILHSYVDQRRTRDGEWVPREINPQPGFEDDINMLKAYSLITGEPKEQSLAVHEAPEMFCMNSQVRKFTREWIATSHEPKRWHRLFSRLMAYYFPIANENTWTSCQSLLFHVSPILTSIEAEGDRGALIQSELLISVSRYTRYIGDHLRADSLQDRARTQTITIPGLVHPYAHDRMDASRDDCPSQLVVLLEQQLLESRKKTFGSAHPRTLASMAELATMYRDRGCLKDADMMYNRIIQVLCSKMGSCHPVTLTAVAGLASVWRSDGRLDEAESLLLSVIAQHRARNQHEILGLPMPVMIQLALTYRLQRRWEESKAVEQDIIRFQTSSAYLMNSDAIQGVAACFEADIGFDDSKMLCIYDNLANMYHYRGLIYEATKTREKTLRARMAIPNADFRSTLNCAIALASVHCALCRWVEAEALYTWILPNLMDEDDYHKILDNLVFVYVQLGQWEDAERVAKMACDSREGSANPGTARSKEILDTIRKCRRVAMEEVSR